MKFTKTPSIEILRELSSEMVSLHFSKIAELKRLLKNQHSGCITFRFKKEFVDDVEREWDEEIYKLDKVRRQYGFELKDELKYHELLLKACNHIDLAIDIAKDDFRRLFA